MSTTLKHPERTSGGVRRRTDAQRSGDAAERSASRFLQSRGLPRVERHFLRRVGEIDLIHVDPADGTVVFVEVRYRASLRFGGPLASLDARKRRALHLASMAWLQAHADPRRPARIDLIAMTRPTTDARRGWDDWEGYRLRWIRNAPG